MAKKGTEKRSGSKETNQNKKSKRTKSSCYRWRFQYVKTSKRIKLRII